MLLNSYENKTIANDKLPKTWQSQESLDDLRDYLQQNWEQRSIYFEDGEVTSQQQFLKFIGSGAISTTKYIGTIIFKGEQLNIFPKVFAIDKNDDDTTNLSQKHLIYNLVKWIEYSNKQDYPFLSISSELSVTTDLKELFVALYLEFVRDALERELYYNYNDEKEDCAFVKGKLDIKDYINKKIPNGNYTRFNCEYSVFEFDNKINRIIKFTCKQLLNSTSVKNQDAIRIILSKLNEVSDVRCLPSDCNNIVLSKTHKQYGIVIGMSKMFLLNSTPNYSLGDEGSFCFLMPTDLLFEGFIGGFIKETFGTSTTKVYLQESKVSLVDMIIYKGVASGPKFRMRHDIVVEIQNGANCKTVILDTKYKSITRFENNNVCVDTLILEAKQSDIYQVYSYARKRGVEDVYLLYPMFRYEDSEKDFPVAVINSPSGKTNVHFVRLPFVFEVGDSKTSDQLKNVIQQILF